ncbi:fructosamine kinase family protein [Aliiroseovarius sp. KMU-50]|uniref:Fructosamine kinase family protein n=1 Tax=Aliiroseovarius salicola TaxID=3009082 RepID=A0ABT4W0V2_9RHOB|nr:fructosamine kinase family protein [Aliiroseovarius sp. KMU-50]MDA5094149.1 fructosamine kinase family protein [Aliiroseovarius sp. KMU-50]
MGGLTDLCIQYLQAHPVAVRPLHGGDLSDVALVTLSDRREVVAKQGPMVGQEAQMLAALSKVGAPVPAVIAANGNTLLMEYLPEAPASDKGWASLGTSLRALHNTSGQNYGWSDDYAFGTVPITNTPSENWVKFWINHRLRPLIDRLPAGFANRVEKLAGQLSEFIPATPKAALLHGDLWSGNVLFTAQSAYLIDPACYYGDGEVDLAMLYLFGTPPAAFRDAYGHLDPGWETRRVIYQVWPALVHVRLFGAGYLPLLDRLLCKVE